MLVGVNDLPVAEILRITDKHGAQRVQVFGSRSRGDERADSDLDLLVAVRSGTSLLDLIRMELELERLLGIEVEVVVETGLRTELRETILAEARPLNAA